MPSSSKFFNFILFADDSTLSASLPSLDVEAISVINSELGNVYRWLCYNKIAVNYDKTKFIIFNYRRSPDFSPLIKIGKFSIRRTDHIKFLGLIVDEHLKFNHYSKYIAGKIGKSIGVIYRLSKFLPHNILRMIYMCLIHPYLVYGIETWYSTHNSVTNNILILQKRACRAISGLSYYAHTSEKFKSLSILKLFDLFRHRVAVFMHQTLFSEYNVHFKSLLKPLSESHHHDTRNVNLFVIPRYNKTMSQYSFVYSGVKTWNELPSELRNIPSLVDFRKKVKNFYLSQY